MTELEEAQQQLLEVQTKIDKLVEQENNKKPYKLTYSKSCLLDLNLIVEGCDVKDVDWLEYGRYRETKKQAEYSQERNKRANRLEMLAMDLGGEYKWKEGSKNYYVYLYEGIWKLANLMTVYQPEIVFMTFKTGKEVCRLLNEGLYSLDKEL